MDQRRKVHGDGVHKQVLRRYDGLAVRTAWSDHTKRPNAELRRDASKV